MKYLDEYRDADAAHKLAREIARITTRPWALMEVCGGQTHAIVKFGIDELLPKQITLIHGPGCPVCVTPVELIDKALEIAARPEVIFCSFGDMLRVPGSKTDLLSVKAERRGCAHDLFATGRGEAGRAAPGQGGRLLRRRLRNHRPHHGDGRLSSRPKGPQELLPARLARAGAARHGGGPEFPGLPRAGFPGRRPRLRRDGLRGIYPHRREVSRAHRGDGL